MANKGKRLLAVLLATAFLLCLFLSGYAEDPGVENPEDDVTKTGETGQDEVTAAAHRNRLRNRKGQKDGADNRNAGNHEPGMPGGPLNGGLKQGANLQSWILTGTVPYDERKRVSSIRQEPQWMSRKKLDTSPWKA